MLLYYVGMHRDFGEAVEQIARTEPINIMSAFEYFRKRKIKEVDRGFKIICRVRQRNKGRNPTGKP